MNKINIGRRVGDAFAQSFKNNSNEQTKASFHALPVCTPIGDAVNTGGHRLTSYCSQNLGLNPIFLYLYNRGWEIRVQISTGAGAFSILKNVRTAPEVHLATYSTGTMVLARGCSGLGVNLSTHLHLVSK